MRIAEAFLPEDAVFNPPTGDADSSIAFPRAWGIPSCMGSPTSRSNEVRPAVPAYDVGDDSEGHTAAIQNRKPPDVDIAVRAQCLLSVNGGCLSGDHDARPASM